MTVNVSIVIPTLNEEESLPRCLDGLVGQLSSGDEVIIVDGGSEDGTVGLAEGFGCNVIVDEDSSIGKARNIGANEASNEVVVTTDADAIPPSGWIERIKWHFDRDEDLVVLWGSIEDRNGVPVRNLVGKFSTFFKGASGNNTAFRKEAFERLEEGYPDSGFMEDSYIIGTLSRLGKARRDNGLVMVMDMDRKRYQTIPMLAMGGGGAILGRMVGGRVGDLMSSAGLGLVGTELTYEEGTGSPFHHDQIGAGVVSLGNELGDGDGDKLIGLGSGIMTHHFLTEGASFMPTELMKNTDEEVR